MASKYKYLVVVILSVCCFFALAGCNGNKPKFETIEYVK